MTFLTLMLLEMALYVLIPRSEDSDLIILTDTNITGQAYCCNCIGYDVVCLKETTMADRDTQGGVGMSIRDRHQGWSIELARFHMTNGVRWEVFANKRTPLIK